MSTLHEECGVFGLCVDGMEHAAGCVYNALYALQHRGQESAGIAINDGGVITSHKDVGLVSEVFTPEVLEHLGNGSMAVGHVRYATTGRKSRSNAQPMVINHVKGTMALYHNGNLTNAAELREKLELSGAIFHTTSDTEVIAYTITGARLKTPSIEAAVSAAMDIIQGAYSLVLLSPRKLIAARDPNGFRPLCIGTLEGGYVFASESCALDAIGARFLRDVEPGEIVVADKDGLRSIKDHCGKAKSSLCVFEFIYFARPDSVIDGAGVHEARLRAGAFLALEHPVQADIVIGVPDSGIDAAIGYARQSGILYGTGFIKISISPAPSSPPARRTVRTRCASSSTPSPLWSGANGWSSWTTPSSGAPPRPGSCVSCGRPVPPRSTCGSPRPPSSTPAISAPTSTPVTTSSPVTTRWRRSQKSSAPIPWATSAWRTSTSWPTAAAAPSVTAASPATTPFPCQRPGKSSASSASSAKPDIEEVPT